MSGPEKLSNFSSGSVFPFFCLAGELKGEAAGLPLAAPSLGISANSGGLRGSPAKMCMTLHSCTTYTLPCVPVGWEFVSAFEPVVLAIERHSFRSRLGGLVSFGLVGGPAGIFKVRVQACEAESPQGRSLRSTSLMLLARQRSPKVAS